MTNKEIKELREATADLKAISRVLRFGENMLDQTTIDDLIWLKKSVQSQCDRLTKGTK